MLLTDIGMTTLVRISEELLVEGEEEEEKDDVDDGRESSEGEM